MENVKRKSIEKVDWEKLKSCKNREGKILKSQQTKVEVAEKESRWCMSWKENLKMMANWRRGWWFRKDNRKRGKKIKRTCIKKKINKYLWICHGFPVNKQELLLISLLFNYLEWWQSVHCPLCNAATSRWAIFSQAESFTTPYFTSI